MNTHIIATTVAFAFAAAATDGTAAPKLTVFNAQTRVNLGSEFEVPGSTVDLREARLPDGPSDAVLDKASVKKAIFVYECAKCDARIRLGESGRWACVNASHFAEQDLPKAVRRAADLLEPQPSDPNVKRPLMGWSTWNSYAEEINEDVIVDNAKAMAENGMQAAGYLYINTDDGFQDGREKDGRLRFYAPRFPKGMKGMVDTLHKLGFKAGIYSDAGSNTCCYIWGGAKSKQPQEKGTGLYGHDKVDMELFFRELGFDFIKVDYCGALQQGLDAEKRYSEIAAAIRATGRTDARLNVCRWAYPGTWISRVAESWRTTGDIRANWGSLKQIIGENLYLSAFASPGHYNDMDMMEVGHLLNTKWTRTYGGDTGFTPDEEQTHFGLWCLMSSPLLMGCRIREMDPATLKLVTNRSLLAMNQNDLGLQGYVVRRQGEAYVLTKDALRRFGTSRYVALYNAGDRPHEFRVPAALVDLAGKVEVLDLVRQADVGAFDKEFVAKVPPHGTRFLRFDAERRVERTVYEAETAYLNAYTELGIPTAPFHYQDTAASGGVVVRGLGRAPGNDLVWKDVKIFKPGKRRLELTVAAGAEPTSFSLSVDGGAAKVVSVPAGAGLVKVATEVAMTEGLHEIRLFRDRPMPDIDVMRISGAAR